MNTIQYKLVGFLLFCTSTVLSAQDLQALVALGWKNNLQLASKTFQLQQAEYAILEAKAHYFPEIRFGTTYSLAEGGRSIDFPIGDLLNPAYSALNDLTQTQNFPQLENQKVKFLPNNFYDSRFRIQQAIYHPDLAINKQVQTTLKEQRSLELKAFKRLLSKEIMAAYFQYKSILEQQQLIETSKNYLNEAKRVCKGLMVNGLAVPSSLLRLETEAARIESQIYEVNSHKINALQYLEFLLGTNTWTMPEILPDVPDTSVIAGHIREELLQLQNGISLQNISLKREKSQYVPTLGAQLDLGSQGFNFVFEPYLLFGINLDWKLVDFKRTHYKKKQIQSNIQALQSQVDYSLQTIELQQSTARNNLISSVQQIEFLRTPYENNKKLQVEVSKRYKEGAASYLEMVDALTQLHQSALTYSVFKWKAWQAWGDYVYAHALLEIR